MKQKLFLLIASISFFSCSQERLTDVADDTLSVEEVSATTQSLLIDKDAESLTSQDAKNVAALFRSKSGEVSSRSASTLASESMSIETIIDDTTSEPLLYIVNWTNDGGFVVVSASKKCFPVACYSETGSFSLDADPASKSYLEGYKSLVRDALNDTSDSLRARYALEWSVFEQSGSALADVSSRATSSDIQDMIDEEIATKTALGYTYIGKITAAADYLTATDYAALIEDVSTHTDSDYDYEEVSLFFIKTYTSTSIGPLMGTEWCQDEEPFNVDADNNLAGCVPIALGQIVYYHKYPEDRYDWDEMTSISEDNEAFIYFIKDIRRLCNVKYKTGATSSSYKDALNALDSLNYEATLDESPTASSLSSSIKSYNPVYMRGTRYEELENDELDTISHAWVCEGYEKIAYKGVISMIPDVKYSLVSTSSSLYQEYTFSITNTTLIDTSLYGDFFYMNMGWKGKCNGWYRSNAYIDDDGHSYLYNQKIILIEKGD